MIHISEIGPLRSFWSRMVWYRYAIRCRLLYFRKLENIESLEQLRALEHGIPIMVWETQHPSIRIDTPEDLAAADRSWEKLMVGSQ